MSAKTVNSVPAKAEATKPALIRYFVLSAPDGGWLIVQEGRRKRLQFVRNKITAIETTKLIARHHAPSEVLVEKQDGSIQLRYTYTDPAIA